MYRIGDLIFRTLEALCIYVAEHRGEDFTIEWITEYTLGDPMEQ
jgi:hypothetical protein